jgi:hypothetical protein
MKSLIFSLISLLALAGLQAQTYSYSPFPKQIGTWCYTQYSDNWTIIGSTTLTYQYDSLTGLMTDGWYSQYNESNKQVFHIYAGDTLLVYDFNLSVGDSVIINNATFGTDTFYVSADDSTGYYGRRKITFTSQKSFYLTTEWVEGIGNINGNWGLWSAFSWPSISGGWGFWCMYGDSASIPCNSALHDLENTLNAFTVFPNPNSGSFTLKTEQPGPNRLTIYNSAGQVVYTSELHGASANRIDLPLAPAGLYILEYAVGKSVLRDKLIIQHY